VHLVEAAVERHYASVRLTANEAERVRRTIASRLEEMAGTAEREIARCEGVLAQVRERERKLLQMHYQERISDELFDDEQARLRRERFDAEALIVRLNVRYEDIAATLEMALKIMQQDPVDAYGRADDTIRRLMNQGIFAAMWVTDEEWSAPSSPSLSPVCGPRRPPWTAAGAVLAGRPPTGAKGGGSGAQKGQSRQPPGRAAALSVGSISKETVHLSRFRLNLNAGGWSGRTNRRQGR
jgi:hypothetical protein